MKELNTLPRFCQEMKNLGLQPVHRPHLGYIYKTKIEQYEFEVLVHEPDEYFLSPPKVTILEAPKLVGLKQTHICTGQSLCYLDSERYYFSVFKPEDTAREILSFIDKTFNRMISPSFSSEDFIREFDNYWHPDLIGYLISQNKTLSYQVFERENAIVSAKSFELLIYDEIESKQTQNWIASRGIKDNKQSVGNNVVLIELDAVPQAIDNNASYRWPLSSWSDFVSWSASLGNNRVSSLLEKVAFIARKTKRILVIFSYKNGDKIQHYFGAIVAFDKSINERINRHYPQKSKKKKSPLKDIIATFKNQPTSDFKRVQIQNATPEFVIDRNIQRPTLEGKKVVVIGCGTVGSHLAKTLVKLGAGKSTLGKITLYDGDYLTSQNLGRHLLNETYLGDLKSHALKHYLTSKTYWPINCTANKKLAIEEITDLLSNCDFIIDVTGNIPFSNMLSIRYRDFVSRADSNACVIHGWVDANGLSVRTLLDDGESGCLHCLRPNGIDRIKVMPKDKDIPDYARHMSSCGESFTPYAESVSITAAALITNTLVDFINGKKNHKFRQVKIIDPVPKAKWQNLKKVAGCPNCES